MLIAIMSDTHDNQPRLEQFIAWAKMNNIEAIIHCGDICQRETLEYLALQLIVPIHIAYGNGDEPDDFTSLTHTYSHLQLHGQVGRVTIADQVFIFNHYPERARELARDEQPAFSLYGHTHKPWEEMVGQTRVINPGTLAGLFQLATFAVYDTTSKKLELKLVDEL